MTNEPAKPDKIRERMHHYAGQAGPTSFEQRKWGAMIGWLNRYLITDELRRLVLGWLFALPDQKFEPISSSTLTPQQKNGISKWIGSWFNEDLQEWEPRTSFEQECIGVLNAARYDYQKVCGQLTMDLPFEIDGEPQGIVKEAMDDPLWNPDESYWCDWCGDCLSVPGVPCSQCAALGAEPVEPKPAPRRVTGVAI